MVKNITRMELIKLNNDEFELLFSYNNGEKVIRIDLNESQLEELKNKILKGV